MHNQWYRRCRYLALVLMLGALTAGSALAQVVSRKPSFSSAKLERLLAGETPQAEKAQLFVDFSKFRPTKAADVDLLYACVGSTDSRLQGEGRDKLCAMRDKALLEASRKYISPANLRQAKVAIEVVRAAKDVEAMPALRQLAADPKARKLEWFARETLAQLGDEELLKDLTDPAKQTPDSTLADFNADLLKWYGKRGFAAVMELLKTAPQGKQVVMRYLLKVRDPDAVGELIKAYDETKDQEIRNVAMEAICAINTRECQPFLRRELENPSLAMVLFHGTESAVIWAVWKYDAAEIKKFQERVLAQLEGRGSAPPIDADQMAEYFREDRDFESKAALALARLLRSDVSGRRAAEALEKLTGQRFQYAKPQSHWAEKTTGGRRTVADARITEESIKANEARGEELLKQIRAIQEKKRVPPDEIEKNIAAARKQLAEDAEEETALLRNPPTSPTPPAPPLETGIPIDQAEKWVREHYGLDAPAK